MTNETGLNQFEQPSFLRPDMSGLGKMCQVLRSCGSIASFCLEELLLMIYVLQKDTDLDNKDEKYGPEGLPGNSGVMPGADSSLCVEEVDLTLLSCPLL